MKRTMKEVVGTMKEAVVGTMKEAMGTIKEAMGTMKEASIVDHNNSNNNNHKLPSCVDDQLLDFNLPPPYYSPSRKPNQLLDFDLPPPYSPSRKPNQPRKHNYPLPDYSLSHKPNQPPPNPRRAMARSWLSCSWLSCSWLSCSGVGLYEIILFLLVLLVTFINIAVALSCFITNNGIALKWQLITLFVQNLVNFLFWKKIRYGNVRKHRNLWNENDDLENGNRIYGNQKNKFWPIWKYSALVLVLMAIAFIRQAPITIVMAMCVHISINILFLYIFIVRFGQGDTSQDFDAGQDWNLPVGVVMVVLLFVEGFLGAH